MGINENNQIKLKNNLKNLKISKQATINYKGIQINKDIHPLMKYMESVEDYREELSSLASNWDNLTVMGQLGHSNIDMSSTKQSFGNLTEELLNHLGTETLKKAVREMTAKAQIAVDIVIRNLFERTADIGFLATDDDIRYFLQHTISKYDAAYDDYVETYKYHDFTPQHDKTLVYSYKVTETNDADSNIIGILSLCFKFTDEMDGIFNDLINPLN